MPKRRRGHIRTGLFDILEHRGEFRCFPGVVRLIVLTASSLVFIVFILSALGYNPSLLSRLLPAFLSNPASSELILIQDSLRTAACDQFPSQQGEQSDAIEGSDSFLSKVLTFHITHCGFSSPESFMAVCFIKRNILHHCLLRFKPPVCILIPHK